MKSFLDNFYRHLAIFLWSHWNSDSPKIVLPVLVLPPEELGRRERLEADLANLEVEAFGAASKTFDGRTNRPRFAGTLFLFEKFFINLFDFAKYQSVEISF